MRDRPTTVWIVSVPLILAVPWWIASAAWRGAVAHPKAAFVIFGLLLWTLYAPRLPPIFAPLPH